MKAGTQPDLRSSADEIGLSLVARRVVMASIAYYGLDTPVMTDAHFDAYCKRLSSEWDDLNDLHKWKLGSAHDIHTSGFHIHCTWADLGGLNSWLQRLGLRKYAIQVPSLTKPTKKIKHPDGRVSRLWYTNVGNVAWDYSKPIN